MCPCNIFSTCLNIKKIEEVRKRENYSFFNFFCNTSRLCCYFKDCLDIFDVQTTVVCRIDLFFDSKFWFSLNIFLSTFRMIVIYLRLCRAMPAGPFRYLEHLHTTAKNFSSVTLKKVFGEKVTFSKIFIRIF